MIWQEVRAYLPNSPGTIYCTRESRFNRVVMCFVEVAGVTTRLTAFFSTCASQCTASQSQACHYGWRDLAGGARLLSNSPGTIYCTRESVLAAW